MVKTKRKTILKINFQNIVKIKWINKINLFYAYLLIVAFSYVFYTIFRNRIITHSFNADFYNHFIHLYSSLLLIVSKDLLHLFGIKAFIKYSTSDIYSNSNIPLHIDYFYYSLKHICIIIFFSLITPANSKVKFYFLLIGLFTILTYNIFRISFLSLYTDSIYFRIIFNFSMLIRNLLTLLLIYFFWQKYPAIKIKLGSFINYSLSETNLVFKKLIAIFAVSFLIETLIFSNLIPGTGLFLTQTLLHISQSTSSLFGYYSHVTGRSIYGYGTAVYMADACLGIDLMLLFAAFVFVLSGNWFHKLWFILSGILIIYLVNSIRVALVYIHLVNHGGYYQLPIEIHNLFTYPVYILTFILWVVWINKFSIKPESQII